MEAERVRLESSVGGVVFDDTVDHFENAVLRLAIDRASFQPWLDASGRQPSGPLEQRLRAGYAELKPQHHVKGDGVLHPRIAENPAFGVAVNAARDEGWLVRGDGAQETTPPLYEEAYFEGGGKTGYGEYLKQAGWRLEKAARQVRELSAATGLTRGRVLDVGSGYGFFRKALAEAGFGHAGIEISAHAREVARQLYGFETWPGPLGTAGGGLDALTLWDVIEHVPDPVAFLREAREQLKPGGFVALKTPNLDCPEAEIFGAAYHSFKREHLRYFTPASLERAASAAGLEAVSVQTVSHLLVGFFGAETLRRWEQEGRGADIIAYFRRPAA